MEVERSGYTAFAVTIRRNEKRDANENDYVPMLEHIMKNGVKIHSLVYEQDSGKTYNGLHIHGIIYIKKGFYRKRLAKDGYHIKLEEIYSWDGWQKYLNKGYIKKIQFATEENYTPTEDEIIDLGAYTQEVMDTIEDHVDDCCPIPYNIFKKIRARKNKI